MANDYMQSKIRILETNCDPSRASDRTLPYTSYLVEYLDDTAKRCYDLIICNKQVDIFDHYWDRYRHNFVGWVQTDGRVNPKLWNPPGSSKKK